MAIKFHQFRYGPNESETTIPTGNIILNYKPVIHLGIQGLPGLEFYINKTTDTNPPSCKIDNTGIFEIDLTGLGMEIIDLQFKEAGEEKILDYPVTIDILYKEAEINE